MNKQENKELKPFTYSKVFIKYLNIEWNIEEYNPNKKLKILIVFDDMIADMLANEKLSLAVTELFLSGRKLTVFLFCKNVLKDRNMLHETLIHCFITRIPSKQ